MINNTNKSERNKTISLSEKQITKYSGRCVELNSKLKRKDLDNLSILGDTFSILSLLPKNSIDLCIIDPPYNLDKTYSNTKFKSMSDKEYYNYTKSYLELLLPLLKNTSTVYICCDWKSSPMIYKALSKYFIVRNRITWKRDKGRGSKDNYKNNLEDIYYCTVSKDFTFNLDSVKIRRKVICPYTLNGENRDWKSDDTKGINYRDTHPSNLMDDITIPFWSMKENTIHPTQKPEKLIAKLILASSNEDDIVLDPFAGSGTTAVVAYKLKRRFVSIEQSKEYCAIQQYRLKLAKKDKTIQGYNGSIFFDRNF